MVTLLALFALQPAPPPPPRTRPDPPVAWRCEIADPRWQRFQITGRFAGIPLERREGYVERGTDGIIETDTSGRFVGTHRAYLLTARGGAEGYYQLIVRAPDRVYFHLDFEFAGERELGSVTIEQQNLGGGQFQRRRIGAGFCRVTPRSEAA